MFVFLFNLIWNNYISFLWSFYLSIYKKMFIHSFYGKKYNDNIIITNQVSIVRSCE